MATYRAALRLQAVFKSRHEACDVAQARSLAQQAGLIIPYQVIACYGRQTAGNLSALYCRRRLLSVSVCSVTTDVMYGHMYLSTLLPSCTLPYVPIAYACSFSDWPIRGVDGDAALCWPLIGGEIAERSSKLSRN